MQRIRKGTKTDRGGVLLTETEYKNYKKLIDNIHIIIQETKHRQTRKYW